MFDPMEANNQQIIAPRRSIDIEFNICEVVNKCECDVQVINWTNTFFCEFQMLLLQRLIGMWKVSLWSPGSRPPWSWGNWILQTMVSSLLWGTLLTSPLTMTFTDLLCPRGKRCIKIYLNLVILYSGSHVNTKNPAIITIAHCLFSEGRIRMEILKALTSPLLQGIQFLQMSQVSTWLWRLCLFALAKRC